MLKSTRFWTGIVISVVCLYFALQGIQFDKLAESIVGMNYAWLILGSLIFLASYIARVFRWQSLFWPEKLRLWNVFHALNVGYFLSNLLPLRLGDFVRAYLIGDLERVGKAQALSTIVVERLFDGLTVVLLLAVTALYVPNIPDEARQAAVGVAVVGVAGLVFLLILSFNKERGMQILRRLASPVPFLNNEKLWGMLQGLVDGFAVLRSFRAVLAVGFWSLSAWLLGGTLFWIIMQAMHLDLPIPAAFLVMTVTSLVVVVPSTPGYVGIFHATAVATLTGVYGVDKSSALGYAIVMHAFNYLWILALGIYSIWHEGLTYERLQNVQSSPPQ